jgi:hypothetical protein
MLARQGTYTAFGLGLLVPPPTRSAVDTLVLRQAPEVGGRERGGERTVAGGESAVVAQSVCTLCHLLLI